MEIKNHETFSSVAVDDQRNFLAHYMEVAQNSSINLPWLNAVKSSFSGHIAPRARSERAHVCSTGKKTLLRLAGAFLLYLVALTSTLSLIPWERTRLAFTAQLHGALA